MRKLAVVFPGIGYTAEKPLLYYSKKIAAENGYKLRLIQYEGFPENVLGDRDKMAACYEIAESSLISQISDQDLMAFDDIVFIGKSIGTILAAKLAAKSTVSDRIRLILYTPMEDTFLFDFGESIVFTGTDDPWVGKADSKIPHLCARRGIPCMVIPAANHSLETGNVHADLETLQVVMQETGRFFGTLTDA